MEFLPFTRPTINEETIELVTQVLRSGWLATGPNVSKLENELAKYLGLTNGKDAFVKLFTSATGALELALRALGVGPGDEVIVPAMTFAASGNVVALCGARPILCDVDFNSKNMTLQEIKKVITKKTKVIMPVHFAGLSVDMFEILEFARANHIHVLEDAAHAIGSSYQGKKIGSFGDIISFSFHPNKNITTIEGGALIVFKEELAKSLDLLRFHGIKKDAHGNVDVLFPSGKFNLPDVNAALGLGQLKELDHFCAKRRSLAYHYFEHLKQTPNITLPFKGDEGHSWHIFAPLIDFKKINMTRDQFIEAMKVEQIGVGVHYPSLSQLTAYQKMGYVIGSFPNAELIGEQTVTLPLFPLMEEKDVVRVCEVIKKLLK